MGSIVTDVDAGRHQGPRPRRATSSVRRRRRCCGRRASRRRRSPRRVAKATGAERRTGPGRIEVRDDLTIAGHPEISVVGDMMSLRKLPGVAEVAMQAGHYAGRRIQPATLAGRPGRGAVPVPRPRLGRLHRPRQRGRVRPARCG